MGLEQLSNFEEMFVGPSMVMIWGSSGIAHDVPGWSLHTKWTTGWWLGHPSEKYESQLGWLFPIYGTIKNVPNHQPDMDKVAVEQIFYAIPNRRPESRDSPHFFLQKNTIFWLSHFKGFQAMGGSRKSPTSGYQVPVGLVQVFGLQ